VRYDGRILQIPEQRHRRHLVKAKVRVHQYPDGRLALFHGPRRLADYAADGTLFKATNESPTGRLTPLGSRRPVDLWITLRVTHNPTGPSSSEADICGHLMCYETGHLYVLATRPEDHAPMLEGLRKPGWQG